MCSTSSSHFASTQKILWTKMHDFPILCTLFTFLIWKLQYLSSFTHLVRHLIVITKTRNGCQKKLWGHLITLHVGNAIALEYFVLQLCPESLSILSQMFALHPTHSSAMQPDTFDHLADSSRHGSFLKLSAQQLAACSKKFFFKLSLGDHVGGSHVTWWQHNCPDQSANFMTDNNAGFFPAWGFCLWRCRWREAVGGNVACHVIWWRHNCLMQSPNFKTEHNTRFFPWWHFCLQWCWWPRGGGGGRRHTAWSDDVATVSTNQQIAWQTTMLGFLCNGDSNAIALIKCLACLK